MFNPNFPVSSARIPPPVSSRPPFPRPPPVSSRPQIFPPFPTPPPVSSRPAFPVPSPFPTPSPFVPPQQIVQPAVVPALPVVCPVNQCPAAPVCAPQCPAVPICAAPPVCCVTCPSTGPKPFDCSDCSTCVGTVRSACCPAVVPAPPCPCPSPARGTFAYGPGYRDHYKAYWDEKHHQTQAYANSGLLWEGSYPGWQRGLQFFNNVSPPRAGWRYVKT